MIICSHHWTQTFTKEPLNTAPTCIRHVLRVSIGSPRLDGAVNRVHGGRRGTLRTKEKESWDDCLTLAPELSSVQRVFCYLIALPRYNSRHRELQRKGFTTRHYNQVAYLIIQVLDPSVNSPNFLSTAYSAYKCTWSRLILHIPAFGGAQDSRPHF